MESSHQESLQLCPICVNMVYNNGVHAQQCQNNSCKHKLCHCVCTCKCLSVCVWEGGEKGRGEKTSQLKNTVMEYAELINVYILAACVILTLCVFLDVLRLKREW